MRKFIVIVLLFLLFVPFFPAKQNNQIGSRISTVQPNTHKLPSHLVKKEIIVRFHTEPSQSNWQTWQNNLNITYYPHKLPQTYLIRSNRVSVDELVQFYKKQNVVYVEPHWIYMTNAKVVPNDEYFAKYQWNLPLIETLDGWSLSRGNATVKVAVIDTGVDLTHPDLKQRLIPGVNVIALGQSAMDDNGHGTHVAGIIGASVNNRQGIAGINWYSRVMPIKALDATGAGTSFSVADGIIEATDRGAKVINMSLGNYATSAFLREAVQYAYRHDVVLVAATGNDNSSQPGYPAAYPEVLAVAATTKRLARASFSNYGSYVDVAAPGDLIASTYMGGQYAALSGTSMATPHVAALAALIRSANPALRNTDVMRILTSTARDLGVRGRDDLFGYGIINVNAAVRQALAMGKKAIPSPTPNKPINPIASPAPSTTPTDERIQMQSLFNLLLEYLRKLTL
jgi:type VII secretion-associated serine protease mycosin